MKFGFRNSLFDARCFVLCREFKDEIVAYVVVRLLGSTLHVRDFAARYFISTLFVMVLFVSCDDSEDQVLKDGARDAFVALMRRALADANKIASSETR